MWIEEHNSETILVSESENQESGRLWTTLTPHRAHSLFPLGHTARPHFLETCGQVTEFETMESEWQGTIHSQPG